MRHGESANNVLTSNKSSDLTAFNAEREADPGLTAQGIARSTSSGLWLKEKGFKIDKFFTTGFKRSILTIKLVKEAYGVDVETEVFN